MHFRLSVWFVSNCNAYSGRDQIVNSIYKSISSLKKEFNYPSMSLRTSIYGRCAETMIEKWSLDEQLELRKNKFYLSFENSKCRGYVTEKLYKILNKEISENPPVPIVMGEKKLWYDMNLPQKSFIHIDEFGSLRELAKYLFFLNSNHTEYMKYLEWRKYYKKVRVDSIGCQLCTNLLEHSISRHQNIMVIENFNEFWSRSNCETNH